jgi:hypothetical protein
LEGSGTPAGQAHGAKPIYIARAQGVHGRISRARCGERDLHSALAVRASAIYLTRSLWERGLISRVPLASAVYFTRSLRER